MPKATFFNLPEEKRARILRAAVEEFARHPYSRASINRIVARAGIAKGSFYQYFRNKEDLYLYLLRMIGEEKLAELRPALEQAQGLDFFAQLHILYTAGLRFARKHPEYVELGRKLLASKENPIFRKARDHSMPLAYEWFEGMLREAIRRREIRPDVDVPMVAYLIAEMNRVLMEYHTERKGGELDETVLRTVDAFIDLLRRGLAAAP